MSFVGGKGPGPRTSQAAPQRAETTAGARAGATSLEAAADGGGGVADISNGASFGHAALPAGNAGGRQAQARSIVRRPGLPVRKLHSRLREAARSAHGDSWAALFDAISM